MEELAVSPEDRVKGYTKSDPVRLASMVQALTDIDDRNTPGDVVEVGVWRGGNIMLTRIMSPRRKCWMYDTFDGMTEPDANLDVKKSGHRAIERYNIKKANGSKWDAVSVEEVQEGFRKVGVSLDDVAMVVGPVEDTMLDPNQLPLAVAILRLDADWYSPTKMALKTLYPRVVPGGFLIVDDYGHWMGCQKAVDDYFGKDLPPYYDADYSCRVFKKC